MGSNFFISCEPGTYTNFRGYASCEKCPDGTWSDSGSSGCYENMKKEDASNWSYYAYDNIKDTKKEKENDFSVQKVARNYL